MEINDLVTNCATEEEVVMYLIVLYLWNERLCIGQCWGDEGGYASSLSGGYVG